MEKIKSIIKDCLEIKGYNPTEEQLEELTEIYTDCQEWDDNDNMITGNSYDEIEDFCKNNAEIDNICN